MHDTPRIYTTTGRTRHGARLVLWTRRHLTVRRVVALVALSALLAPEAAMIIDGAL